MVVKKGETKAVTEEVQAGDATNEVITPEPEPQTEPAVTPEPAKGEGKAENWEQKYKTLEGMHRKTTDELNQVKQDKATYAEIKAAVNQVSQIVTQQGDTLTLITDILSENAVDNEDLQQKVQQAKQKQVAQAKSSKAYSEIMAIAKEGGLSQDAPELESARQAFTKGDYESAKSHTFLAVIGKVKDGKLVKAEATPEAPQEPPKKKVPVITSTTGHVSDTAGMTPSEKIKWALQEIDSNK